MSETTIYAILHIAIAAVLLFDIITDFIKTIKELF